METPRFEAKECLRVEVHLDDFVGREVAGMRGGEHGWCDTEKDGDKRM
jgi:hypothetical protein